MAQQSRAAVAGSGVVAHTEGSPFLVRRADHDDIDTVCALFLRNFPIEEAQISFERFHGIGQGSMATDQNRQKFFASLIETCFMSVTVEDTDGNVVGFAALDDVPIQMMNTPGAGTRWEDWFQATYEEDRVDSMNSLWVSCCLLEPAIEEVMPEILRTTFSTMPELRHILVFVPSFIGEEEAVAHMRPFESRFRELVGNNTDLAADGIVPKSHAWAVPTVLDGVNDEDGTQSQVNPEVLVCQRPDVIAPLFIRAAKVEDHDNLVAVFNAQSEVVTDIYGDYFIAELIEAQNEQNKALVAEVDGRAVGLMCFTSDVDINVLAQCFELDPYDNLLKPRVMQRIRAHSQSVLAGEEPPPMCAIGDYLKVALGVLDVDALCEAAGASRLEDSAGTVHGLQLVQALQAQEFTHEVGAALPDFAGGVMTLMWQCRYLEPMVEGNTIVDVSRVLACLKHFRSLGLKERHAIAREALAKWSEIHDIYHSVREACAAAVAPASDGSEDEDGSVGPKEVEIRMFLKALCVANSGPFTQDFLTNFLIVLHWWGGINLADPHAPVHEAHIKAAFEYIAKSEEGLSVAHPNSPAWLASLPEHVKDVFCVNICCLDQVYQTQALDFLLPAFSLYPDKDYCIITQPHTGANSPLLNTFTIVPPQPQNTFSHVLYVIHRAALLGPPKVRHLEPSDLPQLPLLLEGLDETTQADINSKCAAFLKDGAEKCGEHAFVAEFDEQVVGFVTIELPSSDVVEMLRCCYHLDDYLLVDHHDGFENKGHGRLGHWALNPLFLKYARRIQQGAMRLVGRTVLFMEMDLQKIVSPVFREFLQVAPRRPPQLKKALRKPPNTYTFANVEKEEPTEQDLMEKERQRLLRDVNQTKALSIVAKKLLSESKIPVNARIVVVGASDCGLSFLESLLSIPHLLFNSLTLLAPGGLEYHHSHHLPLIAGSAAYSHQELRRIMLELRVRILDSRMVQIDRRQRCCILHDGSMLPYDYLVVAAGLQDDALHSLKIRSWGVEHVTDGYRRVNGAMSVADPAIRDLLVEGGTLIKSLIWNPLSYAVVYGRSLHAYCVVQGLLMRKVPPTKIVLVLPPRLTNASHQLPVDAFFEGDEVESKIHHILASMSMHVYDGYQLLGIQQDNRERLKALILEEHVKVQNGSKRRMDLESDAVKPHPGEVLEPCGVSQNGLPRKLLACRILITADSVNVDPDIFNSVHGNGLVYDGRLIVDHNFKTTDDGIFGAGRLCEFSRRFRRRNLEKYLRHDGFNGREVGAKLAQALLRVLDPVNGDMQAAGAGAATRPPGQPRPGEAAATADFRHTSGSMGLLGAHDSQQAFDLMASTEEEQSSPDLLPDFFMPIAKGGLLPGNLHFYRVHSCQRSDVSAEKEEPKGDSIITTDTLDLTNGKGHFCRLTVDSFGKVDSITYLGGEELQVESLWSLVGLSETFLNHLFVRWRDGDIPDIIEFLTDEWATALFHDRFMDFCHQIKLEMLGQEEIQAIIGTALDSVNLKEGLSRKLLAQIQAQLPKESVKQLQDHLLQYLRGNTNHLKSYFLPENWTTSLPQK